MIGGEVQRKRHACGTAANDKDFVLVGFFHVKVFTEGFFVLRAIKLEVMRGALRRLQDRHDSIAPEKSPLVGLRACNIAANQMNGWWSARGVRKMCNLLERE